MEVGPSVYDLEAPPDTDLLEAFADKDISIFGIHGTFRQLSEMCPVDLNDARVSLEAKNEFVVKAANEAGLTIEPEYEAVFSRITERHGLERKYSVMVPEKSKEKTDIRPGVVEEPETVRHETEAEPPKKTVIAAQAPEAQLFVESLEADTASSPESPEVNEEVRPPFLAEEIENQLLDNEVRAKPTEHQVDEVSMPVLFPAKASRDEPELMPETHDTLLDTPPLTKLLPAAIYTTEMYAIERPRTDVPDEQSLNTELPYNDEASEPDSLTLLDVEADPIELFTTDVIEAVEPNEQRQLDLASPAEDVAAMLESIEQALAAQDGDAKNTAKTIVEDIIRIAKIASTEIHIDQPAVELELAELIRELFDQLAIEYSPELIESFVWLALDERLDPQADVQLEAVLNFPEADEFGTHELLQKIRHVFSGVATASQRLNILGNSAIKYYRLFALAPLAA